MNAKQLVGFDLVRGLSAVLVVAHHLRAALIVDFGDLESSNVFTRIFYFLMSLGHEAVIVFFVLSGFFVGGSVLQKRKQFSWGSYMFARLSRLWIVLLPTLLIVIACDFFFRITYPEIIAGDFQEQWRTGPGAGEYRADVVTFFGNIFFLQTVAVPCFGTNFVVWSLACEFWYYILFPLAVIPFFKESIAAKVLMVVLFVVCIICLPWKITSLCLVWLVGVVVWMLSRSALFQAQRVVLLGLSFVAFVGMLVFTNHPSYMPQSPLVQDLLNAFFFGVFALLALPFDRFLGKLTPVAHFLSKISFSLYLIHTPLVMFVAVAWFGGQQIQPTFQNLITFTAVTGTIVLCGWLFWAMFEKHTGTLRRRLRMRSTSA